MDLENPDLRKGKWDLLPAAEAAVDVAAPVEADHLLAAALPPAHSEP